MDIHSMRLDDKILVAGLLQKLAEARQVAFQTVKELPELRHVFDDAEALYANTARAVGARYQPVFDHDGHVASRIAAGDAVYTDVWGR